MKWLVENQRYNRVCRTAYLSNAFTLAENKFYRIVGLHPTRRTPWRGKNFELGARHGHCVLNERDKQLPVALDVEMLEFGIADNLIMGIIVQRKIAAIDMRAAKRITQTVYGIEISLYYFSPLVRAYFRECIGCRFSIVAAITQTNEAMARKLVLLL